jgi:uncharacterized paraquat-inducible protein A
VANEIAPFVRGKRYVCCDCNRVIFRPRAASRNEKLCPRCGHEMMAHRSIPQAFGFGIFWSFILIVVSAGAARFVPVTRTTVVSVGLAVCAALACNKLFAASQYFRAPDPAASISRQMLAEGAGAFLVLLVASAILFR